MKKEYLTIHNNILPDYYEKVLEAKRLIEEQHLSVIQVCKNLDISRSTYYKYKDKIFYSNELLLKKQSFVMIAKNDNNALLEILTIISKNQHQIINLNYEFLDLEKVIINLTIGHKQGNNSILEALKNNEYVLKIIKI